MSRNPQETQLAQQIADMMEFKLSFVLPIFNECGGDPSSTIDELMTLTLLKDGTFDSSLVQSTEPPSPDVISYEDPIEDPVEPYQPNPSYTYSNPLANSDNIPHEEALQEIAFAREEYNRVKLDESIRKKEVIVDWYRQQRIRGQEELLSFQNSRENNISAQEEVVRKLEEQNRKFNLEQQTLLENIDRDRRAREELLQKIKLAQEEQNNTEEAEYEQITVTDDSLDSIFEPLDNLPNLLDTRPDAPLFSIYTRQNSLTTQQIHNINEMKQLLYSIKIPDHLIEEIDLSNQFELVGYIKVRFREDFEPPVIFFQRKVIGELEDLRRRIEAGDVQDWVQSPPEEEFDPDLDREEPRLGLIGKTLETVELVGSYLNPLSYIKWGSSSTKIQGKEFNVIHTNWYFRNLRRKFVFGETMFARVHPSLDRDNLRAAHAYSDVASIERTDVNNLVIKYASGPPDYIKCSEADCNSIIKILTEKMNNE
eukprot:TRINITY_DN10163_c0_g1_i1.p1 TRINITY_DN10163_c0_g1~~TRINITY_DN10163_c0_g1_i1.p1  ORF type:complete len:481 (-),score=99.71 TRINITY_DN10163_c0_g1_i1:23-1465(-)